MTRFQRGLKPLIQVYKLSVWFYYDPILEGTKTTMYQVDDIHRFYYDPILEGTKTDMQDQITNTTFYYDPILEGTKTLCIQIQIVLLVLL